MGVKLDISSVTTAAMIYLAADFDTAEDLDPEAAAALAEYERIQTSVEQEQHITAAERAIILDAEWDLLSQLAVVELGLDARDLLDATTADD